MPNGLDGRGPGIGPGCCCGGGPYGPPGGPGGGPGGRGDWPGSDGCVIAVVSSLGPPIGRL
ncbi:hypothetical protein F9B16_24190 [Actinomadura montaniterrae]|uniref:Uncharacterized protein n=1 Tax=Actinomadura montaniterrae TaxID=1803903 RepID=A0A6L3VRL8_9ACTN|nr:hypothetical protein F9B16_24190 [Actinomadura montaniterrae]